MEKETMQVLETAREAEEQEQRLQESEASYLDLDTSVLLDRNRPAKSMALMDRYGIRVFDQDTEGAISAYLATEQTRNDFYKRVIFLPRKTEDRELMLIQRELFEISYTVTREGNGIKKSVSSGPNVGVIGAMVLVLLIVGSSYRRKMQKEREKRLADLNNNYDE